MIVHGSLMICDIYDMWVTVKLLEDIECTVLYSRISWFILILILCHTICVHCTILNNHLIQRNGKHLRKEKQGIVKAVMPMIQRSLRIGNEGGFLTQLTRVYFKGRTFRAIGDQMLKNMVDHHFYHFCHFRPRPIDNLWLPSIATTCPPIVSQTFLLYKLYIY